MSGRMQGKVALVTGAARGQGRAHAVRLAQEGADVIAVDVCAGFENTQYPAATEDDLAETVRLVEALDRRIVHRVADIRDREELAAAVDAGVAELGHLDVVVANAAIVVVQPYDQVTPAIWQEVIDVNLTGTWNTVMAAVPHLQQAGGGSIVLVSSVAGLKGLPFLVPYVAAKHGVVGLMRAFATELARHRIRVNSLHPTATDTPMNHMESTPGVAHPIEADPKVAPMLWNHLLDLGPVGMVDPVDQANGMLFLASDEARFVTGVTLPVDAGCSVF
ncbi:mycofactocin-coupled SDR family oxidoreductase [Blastococcus sp. TF02A-26]|uniref:mycofactocin-coupled SDR family oxidoreductase n=1 Tax=Blastococcus sp. TF02A-26 TaxID=2250577 RepID=UPI000DE8AAF6|nr:mycofactocin-coupled SDR family oxidoreductase [Blastococcus sp. TF02A-26]RBY84409.1 SDR family mycofactocin-dependent oxidoreductase [Blastococcus sp. TF02A-26]